MPKRDISDYEKAQHLADLIRSLLPYLKEFSDEQMKEIEIEANIQGTSFSALVSVLWLRLWLQFCGFKCKTLLTQTVLSGESPSNIIIEQTLCYNDERVYW